VKGEFVIESAVPADPAALYDHYRCHRDIQDLIAWLRSKGVTSKTPLHSLRKEYGSQINARYGLTAAQENAAPCGHRSDGRPLRGKQTAIGLGFRASAQERTDHHSD
jgi:hypothetical protein